MGKKQVAQRVKNNYKPSSSARAQLLLNTNDSYSVVPDKLKLFADILDCNVSPDFQVVLKKMNKKDSTTKLKALKEFASLCDTKDEDTVKEVSALWISQYVNLCKDNEPRIREGAQKSLRSYLNRVHRNVAPFLKRFFAYWFVAQFDTHPPTASVATSTFENTFPPKKRTEVVVFCQKEIYNYLIDNITNPVLLNTKGDSDEIKEMQIRTATSCLYATAMFLDILPKEHITNIESELKSSLLNNSTYWKLNKHPTPSVRQAWYTLMHSLLDKLQHFFQDECKKVAFAVFDNVDEDNVTVSLTIWKNILLVFSRPELNEFWINTNAEKIFLPKLWKVFSCSKGCVSSAYANILDLCKSNPIITSMTMSEYHLKCVTSIVQGLEKMSTRFDRTNFITGVETLFDYVIYCIKNNYQDESFCKCMVFEVINMVKFSLAGKLAKNMTPPVISHLTILLEVLTNDSTLHNLKHIIWNSLNTILVDGVNKEIITENIQNHLHVHLIVLNHLKSPEVKKKKNLRVTFEEQNGDIFIPAKPLFNDSYKNDLADFVNALLQFYLDKSSCPEVGYLHANHVCQVISAFKNYGIEKKLSITLVVSNDKASPSYRFYESFVKTWLNDDKILTYNLISLIIGLLESIDDSSEQIIITEDLNLFGLSVVLKEIMRYINEGYTVPEVISNWLETAPLQDEFKKFIIDQEVDDSKLNLLVNCLKLKENTVCERWTNILLDMVCKNPSPPIVIMLRQIFEKNLNDKTFVNSHLKLIFDSLECLIRTYLKKSLDGESRDQHELNQTWKIILNNMLDIYSIEIVNRCCSVVIDYVITTENHIEHVESTVDQFLDDLLSCTKCENIPLLVFYELFKQNKDYEKLIKCCELASYFDGSLLYSGSSNITVDYTTECFDTVYALYSHTYIFSKLIMKFFNITECLSNQMEDVNQDFIDIMVNVVCNVNVIVDVLKYFSNRKYCCQLISSIVDDTKTCVAELLQSQTKNVASCIVKNIIEKTINDSAYWSKSLESILDILSLPSEELINLYKTSLLQYSDSPNMIYVIQIFVYLCGMDNLEYDHLTLPNTRCIWNGHFKRAEINETLISQFERVLESEEKLLTNDVECLTENKKIVEAVRNAECLNIIYTRANSSIQLKYSKLIFNRLNSWLLALTTVDFDNVTFLPVGILTINVGSLFANTMKFYNQEFYKNIDPSCETMKKFKTDTKILHEYMANIWTKLSRRYKDDITQQLVLESFSNLIEYIELENTDEKCMFSLCCELICSDCYAIEITAYTILQKLCECHKVSVETDEESDEVPFELSVLPLQRLQNFVTLELADIKIGNAYEPIPFTENFKNTRVYLLLWNVIFKLCSKLESQERYKYISHLNDENSISCLSENLLKLMPHSIIKTYASNDVNPIIKGLFNSQPSCSSNDYWDNKKLWHLVCWTYYNLLHTLPAVVRKWWVDSEHKVSTLVDKLTTKYVSQSLIVQEFQDIKQAKKIDNIVVTLYENRGILVVSYIIEETPVDITIQMASNHPLGLIRVSSDRSMINMSQWKLWLKQLALFFSHQNGSIIDGISLWQLNISQKFDGVEECYICYSILHNSNYQLPKSACRTCHKKFHSSCLYKWFVTSNKSTCPICRNLF